MATLLHNSPRTDANETASRIRLLNTTQAAAALGIGRRTLQEKVEAREVACVKIGRCIRFDPRDLEDFIERNRVKAMGWKGAAR